MDNIDLCIYSLRLSGNVELTPHHVVHRLLIYFPAGSVTTTTSFVFFCLRVSDHQLLDLRHCMRCIQFIVLQVHAGGYELRMLW